MTLPEDPGTPIRASETGWPSASPLPPPPAPVEQPASAEKAPPSVEEAADEETAHAEVPPSYADEAAHVEEPAFSVDPHVDDAYVEDPAYTAGPAHTEDPAYTEDAEPEPDPIPGHRHPSAWRSAPVIALLLTTLLMAVANGFVWYLVHQNSATENARRAGLEASRDAARVLFSYDYRTLANDFSAGKAVTTGTFRSQYVETTSKVVTSVAIAKKAVVKADVVTAGVVRASESTVVTIVYVNQVTTSSLQQGPKVDLSRVRMTVKHVGGRWLVSNVEAL